MKKVLFIPLIALFFIAGTTTLQAQFLDKLSKKVEQKVENTVIDKTSKKAEKETGKAVDKVLEGDSSEKETKKKDKKQKSSNSKSTSVIGGASSGSLKSSYEFTHNYQLKMTTSQGTMNLDYYLKPNSDYLGAKINQGGMEMFMIIQQGASHMFMNAGGTKMVTSTSLDADDFQDDGLSDYTITTIPDKNFLGYNCKGIKMENSENEIILYYTADAPVSFNDVFGAGGGQQTNIPNAVKEHFKDGALMMYMDMKDKVGKGKDNHSGTFECVKIEKTSFTFSTEGYTKM